MSDRLRKRAKEAAQLKRSVMSVWNRIGALPKEKRDVQLMDRILRAKTYAHNLAWDLAVDAGVPPPAERPPKSKGKS